MTAGLPQRGGRSRGAGNGLGNAAPAPLVVREVQLTSRWHALDGGAAGLGTRILSGNTCTPLCGRRSDAAEKRPALPEAR